MCNNSHSPGMTAYEDRPEISPRLHPNRDPPRAVDEPGKVASQTEARGTAANRAKTEGMGLGPMLPISGFSRRIRWILVGMVVLFICIGIGVGVGVGVGVGGTQRNSES